MNLPDAEYCNYCGKAIGALALGRIRKRKMDFVMIGMEMNLGILEDCFHIVLKRMLEDDLLGTGSPTSKRQEKDVNTHQTSDTLPKKNKRSSKV
jgi:hypothetical protein